MSRTGGVKIVCTYCITALIHATPRVKLVTAYDAVEAIGRSGYPPETILGVNLVSDAAH